MASAAYEELEPSIECLEEPDCNTLLLHLQGFKKSQLKVQIIPTKKLIVNGERPLEENRHLRFQKEFPLPENCDTKKISAKFEDSILYIRQPKLIAPADKEPPKPQNQTLEDQPEPPQVESSTLKQQSNGSSNGVEKSEENERGNRNKMKNRDQDESLQRTDVGVIQKLNPPRRVMSLVLVVLIMAIVLGRYVKNFIGS